MTRFVGKLFLSCNRTRHFFYLVKYLGSVKISRNPVVQRYKDKLSNYVILKTNHKVLPLIDREFKNKSSVLKIMILFVRES